MSINRWIGMGRLTAQPELKKTNSGASVCSFTIAVDRDRQRDKSDVIPCVAWNQTAEFVCNYFDKGRLIAVNGSLQNREWTDRDGHKRTASEITVDRVWFCGDKKGEVKAPEYTDVPDDDGDLPFRGKQR